MATNNEIKYIQSIIGRAELNESFYQHLQNQSSGNDGENYFKSVLDCIPEIIYITDYQFQLNNHVQIDAIVIDDSAIYLFEIKNYKGIYEFEGSNFKNNYGGSMTSPMLQIDRINFAFQKLTANLNINKPIITKLVFTNPYFNLKNPTLYKDNIILPSEIGQLKSLFKNNHIETNMKIKQKLLNARNDFSHIYQQSITIPFRNGKPGIRCPKCKRLYTVKSELKKQKCQCQLCEEVMDKTYVYEKNLLELWYLKQQPFTIEEAMWWLGEGSEKSIRRLCNKLFLSETNRYKKYYLEDEYNGAY
ncbi:nuclease-related domain-containing protein [Mammaliicoccus sp. Dog046]|uniref:nuclease-related domain-containing protein n=1 Tax=Mammaliicoccus sp. Dog046 TaxID=3034233 RepID=UPI002B25F86E|nr:nuclease-related domain-containing protein [Mammaliicoccus sp. Dog046]WQK86278.1 nuclease-related domain-containing protein [Mammaliicoccus sp. Dog046]